MHVTLFVVKYFFFNLSPCSYDGLFYGHAMFIGNSQKEARYLIFPVFIAVQFIGSPGGWGGGYSSKFCIGVCRKGSSTLTLFKD